MSEPTISFPTNPPFSVDFSQYSQPHRPQERESFIQKVSEFCLTVIDQIRFLFVALGKASYSTLNMAGKSFMHIVLGYYGNISNFRPPSDIYLAAFKVVLWIFGMAWCILTTTARLIYERNQDPMASQALLTQFAGSEIDVSHIKTHVLAIDLSAVPPAVAVDDLIGLFDQIDFQNSSAPNYVASTSRQEGSSIYTPDELRESLKTFIRRVKEREAFLGTPPAYDTPRLLAFYQQIEDAVRFSIHNASEGCTLAVENYNRFMAEHDDVIPDKDHLDQKEYGELFRAYNNSCENRARLVIDLAIAGKHCGARYMGEAMGCYDSFNGDVSMGEGTLEDAIVEVLAAKRKEIANEEIQTRLGSDTHHYNNYMSSLGHLLAIPGTENVIEHLSVGLDRTQFLRFFFEKYTVDCLIDTINSKIKTSQALREKISDWVSAHPENWNSQMDEGVLNDLVGKLNSILANQQISENFPDYQSFLRLQGLMTHLKTQNVRLPTKEENGDDFPDELLALDEAKVWFREYFATLPLANATIVKKAKIKEEMKALFSRQKLGEALIDMIVSDKSLTINDFFSNILALQKTSEFSQQMTAFNYSMSQEVILRVVQGQKGLKETILEQHEQKRGRALLEQLIDPDILQVKGLSPGLMEWILVSQHILLPQEVR